jgi:molybdenum cofactor cytidylyltransferase
VTDIVGILLAAGEATRFGADKLMHPLPGGTPIALASARHLVQALPTSVAVVRSTHAELAHRLSAAGMTVVECAEACEGMGRTLAAGVRSSPEAAGWVVALADMPFIRPETIREVAQALRAGASIAAAALHGERGHPVGFAARYFDELSALRGDQGARDILRRDTQAIVLCETDDPGVLRDIDTPGDLAS